MQYIGKESTNVLSCVQPRLDYSFLHSECSGFAPIVRHNPPKMNHRKCEMLDSQVEKAGFSTALLRHLGFQRFSEKSERTRVNMDGRGSEEYGSASIRIKAQLIMVLRLKLL